ncbi:MAG: tetratricopeptide repeat protein [Agromyces sp.]
MSNPSLRGAVDLSTLAARGSTPPPSSAAGGSEQDAPPAPIIDGTDANFQAILDLSRTVPVVVDLWATWCGPSTQLSPVLEKLAIEYGGRLVLAKVDVDANPGLAQAFQAQSIPTVVALIGGQAVPMFTGALPEAQVRDVFEKLLEVAASNGVTGSVPVSNEPPSAAEPAPAPLSANEQAALDAIDRGDYAAAAAAYRAALVENPRDAEASAGLAQVNLLGRLQGKTLDDIRNAAALNPTQVSAQLDVADLDISGGHIEDAFARMLEVFAQASVEDRKLIRERLLELFEVVGVTDPRVNAARSKLSALLY